MLSEVKGKDNEARIFHVSGVVHQKADWSSIHEKICQLLIPLRTTMPFYNSEEERQHGLQQQQQRQVGPPGCRGGSQCSQSTQDKGKASVATRSLKLDLDEGRDFVPCLYPSFSVTCFSHIDSVLTALVCAGCHVKHHRWGGLTMQLCSHTSGGCKSRRKQSADSAALVASLLASWFAGRDLCGVLAVLPSW